MSYRIDHQVTKQSSRKLYSHLMKDYVSITELLQKIIKEDHNISIKKKVDKEDITLLILTQAIAQDYKEKIERNKVSINPTLAQEVVRFYYNEYDGDLFKLLLEVMVMRKGISHNLGEGEKFLNQ